MGRPPDEFADVLRRRRPLPPDDYVASLARTIRGSSGAPRRGFRVGLAVALSVLAAAALAVTGGMAQPMEAPKSVANVAKIVKKAVISKPATKQQALPRVQITPAFDQYEDGEGCTPGFWKNHPEAWAATGFTTGQTVGSVFSSAPASVSGLTLLQGLDLGGGGVNALTRAAIAAILNAAHPSVDYPMSVTEIVNAVNAAFASGDADTIEDLKDTLDEANNLGSDFCD